MLQSVNKIRWLAISLVLGLAGCSGETAPPLAAMRAPRDEPKKEEVVLPGAAAAQSVESEFQKKTGESLIGRQTTTLVFCYAPKELHWDNEAIDYEIAKYVAYQCNANQLKVIDPDRVYDWLAKNKEWRKPAEIGAAFNVDYVMHIDVMDFSLFEANSANLYRGRAECIVNIVKMNQDRNDGEVIYTQPIKSNFPTRAPVDSNAMAHSEFKRRYLSSLSSEIGRIVHPVPADFDDEMPADRSTDDSTSDRRNVSGSKAVALLRENMREDEVAAALQITEVDEKRFLFTGPLTTIRYICRGRRFPSEYIDCQFDWWSTSTFNEAGECVRGSDYVLTLKHWDRIQDRKTIQTLEMRQVETDFAVRRARELNASMRAMETDSGREYDTEDQ